MRPDDGAFPRKQDDQERLQDMWSAVTTGAGLGLAMLGVLAVPILSLVGLVVSYLGLRRARPGYLTGRIAGIVGMVVGILGLALLVLEALLA
jgi:hypothetical protein